jgi:hypothetical protein
MKSISALVDATNLISQDRGSSSHVFDADKLSGSLHARMAKDHEQVLALNEKTYVLDSETIVIADDSFGAALPASWAAWIPAALKTPKRLHRIRLVRSGAHRAHGPRRHYFRRPLSFRARRTAIRAAWAGALHPADPGMVWRRGFRCGDRGRCRRRTSRSCSIPSWSKASGGIRVARETHHRYSRRFGFVVGDHDPAHQFLPAGGMTSMAPPTW